MVCLLQRRDLVCTVFLRQLRVAKLAAGQLRQVACFLSMWQLAAVLWCMQQVSDVRVALVVVCDCRTQAMAPCACRAGHVASHNALNALASGRCQFMLFVLANWCAASNVLLRLGPWCA